jgi:hypothetical protein
VKADRAVIRAGAEAHDQDQTGAVKAVQKAVR